MVIQPRFHSVGSFRDGLASVQLKDGDKWGFIDRSGKFVIPPQFDEIPSSFFNGLSVIRIGTKRGYIDKTGRYVWPPTE
jgi:hypothetical protein